MHQSKTQAKASFKNSHAALTLNTAAHRTSAGSSLEAALVFFSQATPGRKVWTHQSQRKKERESSVTSGVERNATRKVQRSQKPVLP